MTDLIENGWEVAVAEFLRDGESAFFDGRGFGCRGRGLSPGRLDRSFLRAIEVERLNFFCEFR